MLDTSAFKQGFGHTKVRHSHTGNNENATKIRNWNHYTP